MTVLDVELLAESQSRYLSYALSVVHNRALPDVRDGLKPVQRRILYAMVNNLHLTPEKHHRKSAAVVGEVLARFHPHGDAACYEAMVRMAQDFSLRYPLVDGQGNFGSLDGDAAAAYRYTEAKLKPIALEVIGDIGQETVSERDNFDQTTKEPVVLPSRVPNLLMNGASGIAVGMATAIPPHNLSEIIKALLQLIEDPELGIAKILQSLKGPDFPTGCSILNTKKELKEIYSTGRGAVRMRADYKIESGSRGKKWVVVSSVPYAVDKSQLVEKIADLIISRKLPQLVDVRDESTDEVRIVLELATDADGDAAMLYLFKNTALESNFNVNLTAIVPTANPYTGKPALLNLREMLQYFIDFRIEVTRLKLTYEKGKLDERIHLLQGIASVYDALNEVIKIVRGSEGRSDGASKLQKRFKLSEAQALFIVDLRIYQLSRTSIDEIQKELREKSERVKEISAILKSDKALKGEVKRDLERIQSSFGDLRKSKIVDEVDEVEFDAEAYVQHEDCFAIITKDGWLKRIRQTNDPSTTRLREGDAIFASLAASTKDSVALFTNIGNVFVTKVFDFASTSGFGEPVQKMFRFQDGEQIVSALLLKREVAGFAKKEFLVYTEKGLGFRMGAEALGDTKKIGKRIIKVRDGDKLVGVLFIEKPLLLLVSEQAYGLLYLANEVSLLSSAGKGVILQRLPKGDRLVFAASVTKNEKVSVLTEKGTNRDVEVSALSIAARAQRGNKVLKRGSVVGKPIDIEKSKEKD